MQAYIYFMIDVVQKQERKKRKLKGKTKMKIVGLCCVFFVILIFVYYFNVVCPVVVSLSKDKIHSIATSSVSEVVGEVLDEKQTRYSDLVKISYSASGDVELIEIDSVQVNILIRDITAKVQERFDALKSEGIGVAIGTFSGIPFLYGLGPDISVQLVPVGTVKTTLDSSFSSAGINQTIHRLYFVVATNIGMVLPANTQSIETQLEVLICENVIVGKIPGVYLQGQLF